MPATLRAGAGGVRPARAGRGWLLGLGRYSGETLEWFRIFSLSPRPKRAWERSVLTYDGRWQWDFKTYLIELTFELHTVHPRKKIADARYHQPSIMTKAADGIIHDLLAKLFAKS